MRAADRGAIRDGAWDAVRIHAGRRREPEHARVPLALAAWPAQPDQPRGRASQRGFVLLLVSTTTGSIVVQILPSQLRQNCGRPRER